MMEMHELYKPYGMMVVPPGKETSDFRGRWVCTENDYKEISLHDLPSWCPLQTQAALREEGAKQERERVLKEFEEVIRLHDVDELLYADLYNEFLKIWKVQSLRGQHGKKD